MALFRGACRLGVPLLMPLLMAATPAAAQTAAPAETPARVLPALTLVQLEIDAPLSSKTAKIGDHFPLHLALPIALDGREVIPAGARGEGEVIHAKKAGMSGSAGILLLAARYIDVGGKRLKLRSMQLQALGKGNETAAVLASAAVGVIGFLVTGSNSEVVAGSRAAAKTAEDFALSDNPQPAIATLSQDPKKEEGAQ